MNFRVRFKVEVCERSKVRPRDWREEVLSLNVEATDTASALEKVQLALQVIITDAA